MTDWYHIVKLIGSLEVEAEQRGDDRASAALREIGASVLAAQPDLAAAEARREKDRKRKRDKARGSVDSTESAESTESVEKGGFPPDPLSTKKQPAAALPRAKEMGMRVELVDSDGVPLSQVDEIDEAVAKYAKGHPVAWPAVSRFLSRRPLRTWSGWLRQMTKDVGMGSQFTEEDLATVCDHDEALDRPIGSPLGLSGFLGKARQQRLNPAPANLEMVRPARGSTPAQRTAQNGREALKDIA